VKTVPKVPECQTLPSSDGSPVTPTQPPVSGSTTGLRVLHVTHRLSMGGITNWLVDILRRLDDTDICFDFAVHRHGNSPYLEEILARGSRVFLLPDRRRFVSYCSSLYRLLRHDGPFAAVHSHYHQFSGAVLTVAAAARVPVRVAHAHKDSGPSPVTRTAGRLRRFLLTLLLSQCCTHGFACSPRGASSLWGQGWRRQRWIQLFPYGFDPAPFTEHYDVGGIRKECAIPDGAFVVGHVGNFTPVKNHFFLLKVFREVLARRGDSYLVLVGDGELREPILAMAQSLDISSRIRMLGFRKDLAAVMALMDVLVFPSLIEGLPITVLQAQFGRLPVVASTAVPNEAAITDNIHFLSPGDPADKWATCAVRSVADCRPWPPSDDPRFVAHTIDDNVRRLLRLYHEGHSAFRTE